MGVLDPTLNKPVQVVPGGTQQVEIPNFLQPDRPPSGRKNLGSVVGGPERYKQAQDIADRQSLSPTTVLQQLDSFQGAQGVAEQGLTLDHSPILDEWLGKDPFNAGLSQDDIENLSFIERIQHGDRAEVLQRDFLEKTFGAMGLPEGAREALAADEARRRLAAHGVDEADDLTSAFVEAWRVMRGMADAVFSPEGVALTGGGALVGGGIGAAGGPFGFGAGVVGGTGVGLGAAFALDSFVLETADGYNSLVEAGMDRSSAQLPAYIMGGINAALELGGAGLVAKPLIAAGKRPFRDAIVEEFTRPEMLQLFTSFARDYGIGVGGEVATEVLQELVQVIGQNIEAAKDDDVEAVSMDEAAERIGEIAKRTAKAMIVLGPLAPGINVVSTVAESKRVQTDQQKMDSIHEIAKKSKLRERNPEKFGEFIGDVMAAAGKPNIWIDAQTLINWARDTQQPGITQRMGVTAEQLEDARRFGHGVKIKSSKFAENVSGGDHYETIAPHIRYREEGLSITEAQEEASLGLDEELNATNTAAVPEEQARNISPGAEDPIQNIVEGQLSEIDRDIEARTGPATAALRRAATAEKVDPITPSEVEAEIAQVQMGMDGMYKTAEEAGFTDQQFAEYQANILNKQQRQIDQLKDQKLKQEQREKTQQWQNQLEVERTIAEQDLSRTQTYSSLADLGDQRLSRAQIVALAGEAILPLLPKVGKRGTRNVFGTKKNALNVEDFAQAHNYANGLEMLEDWQGAVPFQRAVEVKAENAMFAKNGDLNQELQAIEQARENLFNSDQTSILMQELNQLRQLRKAGKVSRKLMTQEAQQLLARTPIGNSQFARFQAEARRHAKLARRAIRAGDRRTAEAHKFQQILNQEAGIAALKSREDLNKKLKYLRKMNKNTRDGSKGGLPVRYKQAIQHVLSNFTLAPKRPAGEENHLVGLSQDEARGLLFTDRMMSDRTVFWSEATRGEINDLHATVKALEKTGKDQDKLVRGKEKVELTNVLSDLFEALDAMNKKDPLLTRSRFNDARRFGRAAGAFVLNTDSTLRHMDGFKEFGKWYTAIKGGHDRLYSQTFLPRSQEANERLEAIFSIIGDREFGKQAPDMAPGVTKNMQLMAALQLGNEDGTTALMNHPLFSSEEQVQALKDSLNENDVQFLNAMSAYLKEFFPEIKAMEESRRNYTPIEVVATPYETPGGTVNGGYVPLAYDNLLSIFEDVETYGSEKNLGLFGAHAAAHTSRHHTEQRVKNAGQPVALDLRSIQAHVGTVLWDLVMGNELQQVFKILHDTRTTEAMRDAGFSHYQDSLKLWLRDVITGELYSSNWMERGFRYWRQGLTISRLGWNLKTAMLQPLGLVNTAALLGKFNTIQAMRYITMPSMRKFAQDISPVMQARGTQWSVDQAVVQQILDKSLTKKLLGNKGKAFFDASGFWLIRKMQAFVDNITFFAAYSKGMKDFHNDQDKAVQFAELMVNRTQGSAIFAQRSAAERGSLKMNSQQTEFLRMWTPFMSYFVAKNNVLFERTKKTRWQNPLSIANWVTDVAMMFWMEGVVVALMTGAEGDEVLEEGAKEGIFSLAAGLPFVRGMVSEARGFAPGLVGSTGRDIGQLMNGLNDAFEKGDLDRLAKAGTNLTFQALHFPGASQIGRAIDAFNEPGSVEGMELVFGVHR